MESVTKWLDSRQQQLSHPDDDEPTEKKVTARLPLDVIDKLDYIAERTLLSRTRVVEQLIEVAARDAYEQVMSHPFFSTLKIEQMGNTELVNDLEQAEREGTLNEETKAEILAKHGYSTGGVR